MRPSRFGLAGALAAGLIASLSMPAASPSAPNVTVAQQAGAEAQRQAPSDRGPQQAVERAIRRNAGTGRDGWRGWQYPRRDGWTNARYKRAAAKRRNQQRNRRAHRG